MDMKKEMEEKSKKLKDICHEDFKEVQDYFYHKSAEKWYKVCMIRDILKGYWSSRIHKMVCFKLIV